MMGFKHSSRPIRPPISDQVGQRLMVLIVLAYLAIFSWSCRPDPASQRAIDEQTDKTTVFVSILPQAYFVERVGGEYVNVQVLVGPGQSPATYEPTSQQIESLGSGSGLFSDRRAVREQPDTQARSSVPADRYHRCAGGNHAPPNDRATIREHGARGRSPWSRSCRRR